MIITSPIFRQKTEQEVKEPDWTLTKDTPASTETKIKNKK
jgi:hypothetical protein